MSTGTPVVVSRIQNRRGLQAQFDALYPTYPGTGPNILQPGEIALCTDTRRVFIGNVNGQYVEVGLGASGGGLSFTPIQVLLPPSASFIVVPGLGSMSPTSFLSIPYDVNDAAPISGGPAAPNTVGATFSRNGQLTITAINSGVSSPIPATLTDNGTEVNATTNDISFSVSYTVEGYLQLLYMHNFSTSLTFSTTSIVWTII